MRKIYHAYIIIFLLILINPLVSEDYQYQYFQNKDKGKYTPFSDYIPKVRLHNKTVPHYLEDYYQLYGMKLYYNENSLRKNIARMGAALSCKFRHPSRALVPVDSVKEYKKYRKLMVMRINLLIMRNYLKIGFKYDKRRLHFYNLDFAKDIRDSLVTAEKLYKQAVPFWSKARQMAFEASKIKITTRLSQMESERYRIITGDLNFQNIINSHLKKVYKKKNRLDKFLSSN